MERRVSDLRDAGLRQGLDAAGKLFDRTSDLVMVLQQVLKNFAVGVVPIIMPTLASGLSHS